MRDINSPEKRSSLLEAGRGKGGLRIASMKAATAEVPTCRSALRKALPARKSGFVVRSSVIRARGTAPDGRTTPCDTVSGSEALPETHLVDDAERAAGSPLAFWEMWCQPEAGGTGAVYMRGAAFCSDRRNVVRSVSPCWPVGTAGEVGAFASSQSRIFTPP